MGPKPKAKILEEKKSNESVKNDLAVSAQNEPGSKKREKKS